MLEETGRQAAYCKHTVLGFPNRLICTVTQLQHIPTHTYLAYIKGACAMGRFDLTSTLTVDCHSGLCFYGHPR